MILTDQAEAMGVKNTNDLTDNMKENKKGKMIRQPTPVSSLTPVMQQTLLSLWLKAWENIKSCLCSFEIESQLFTMELL